MLKKKFIILGTAIAILLVSWHYLTYAPPTEAQPRDRIRGVWLTHVGTSALSYSNLTDKAFHSLAAQNFNTVYIDVYNRGVTYRSKYAPRNRWISFPFTNPFNKAIHAAKRQGLSVYGWYEYGMMAGLNDELSRRHPDWLLTTPGGEQYIEKHLWLDPNNPEVREYFVNLFSEAAYLYPKLTGIQLDDHWGIPAVFGNYQQAMNSLTREVNAAVKKANPDMILSLSPNPYGFSLTKYSQDWMLWLKKGWFDELVMQIYRPNSNSVRQSTLTSGIQQASNYVSVAVGIYAGGEDNLKSLEEINNQTQTVTELGYGYAIFTWEYYATTARIIVVWIRKLLYLIFSLVGLLK